MGAPCARENPEQDVKFRGSLLWLLDGRREASHAIGTLFALATSLLQERS